MKAAWGKVHKRLARKEEAQVCWSQYLFWVLKEIPQKDLPIFSPKNTNITGTTLVLLIHKKTWKHM